MDVMSSLLAEIKAGTKLGDTFVFLLNLFLIKNRRSGESKTVEELSIQNLADSVDLDCEELTGILNYLTKHGFLNVTENKNA